MLNLTRAFTDAPFMANGWALALEELARQTGAERAQIIGIGGPSAVPFNYVSNLGDRRMLDEFVAIEGGSPRVNWRVAATKPLFELSWEEDYRRVRAAQRFSVYDDFAQTYHMPHGCQTMLANDENGFLGLATLRTEQDGATTVEDRALFAAAAPAALRAIRVQQAVHNEGAQLLVGAMEAVASATFLLDTSGRVVALTPAAEKEARREDVIGLRARRLRGLDRASDLRLQAALARQVSAGPARVAEQLWLAGGRYGVAGRLCTLSPLPAQGWGFGVAAVAMLTVRQPDKSSAANARLLREAFGFSAAEAEVALLIAAGRSRGEVAQSRGVRPETVNDQLKSIFRKAEVQREAELVARLRPFVD